jgi:hypothetical protein
MFGGETSRWTMPRERPECVAECVVERAADLPRDVAGEVGVEGLGAALDGAQDGGERLEVQVVVNAEDSVVADPHVDDRLNVHVVQEACDPRLVEHPVHVALIFGQVRQHPPNQDSPLKSLHSSRLGDENFRVLIACRFQSLEHSVALNGAAVVACVLRGRRGFGGGRSGLVLPSQALGMADDRGNVAVEVPPRVERQALPAAERLEGAR